jgi:hypothetical protein
VVERHDDEQVSPDRVMASLLAVDFGLRTGLALYGPDGRLLWCRSQHFATRAALRRGAHGLLDASPNVAHLVLEGGGPIADIWSREVEHRGIAVLTIYSPNRSPGVFTQGCSPSGTPWN